MPTRRDSILVVDIEATCWETDGPPEGQVNEIIEIGLCLYDLDKDQIAGKRSILVYPIASRVSPFCTKLTTITAGQLEAEGIGFADACRILVEEYGARKMLWASWGGYDHSLFRKQCRRMGLGYPFGKKHLNVKRVFADCNGGRRAGMTRALSMANLELQGIQHRGHDDAWNTAKLLQYLVHKHGTEIIGRFW